MGSWIPPELAERLRQLTIALRLYQPERVYLFGSTARGDADELSDLDIVIIKPTAVPFIERLLEVGRLLPAGVGAVDLLVYTPDEFETMLRDGNAFAQMIVEEGRLLHVESAAA